MKPESHPIPEQRCPGCQFEVIGAFELDGTDSKPVPGTVMICGDCGAVNVLGEELLLRPLSAGEEAALMADPQFARTVRTMRENVLLFHALQDRKRRARKAGSN